MLADYSVELGRDDPALELPWGSDDPALRYHDLKKHPELLREIPEAAAHPELGAFLARINAPDFPLATAKCDAWPSREILPEEEIFFSAIEGTECKFASYIDLVFSGEAARLSLEKHEALAQDLCRLLKHAPEIAASMEFIIRRCYYHQEAAADSTSGFYLTAYISAFGHSSEEARKQWTIALALAQNALVQATNG
ncbi:MAG TPA: hypothetical protein VKL99_08930 [Candidatus Angelobacter sp.]|nr:hypothetical protein [Candidatus Angelobacter sp.]